MNHANDNALWGHWLIDGARRGVVLDIQAGVQARTCVYDGTPSLRHQPPGTFVHRVQSA